MTHKLRGKFNFPATVTATGGIGVSKTSGIWTIEPTWTDLDLVTTLDTPEDKQLWVYDPIDLTYSRLSVDALIDALPAGATGPTGPTGPAGPAGAVAVSGTPTVNQFANWTDATTIKGTSITGLVKGNGASDPTAATDGTDYLSSTTGAKQGKQTIFIPANAMKSRTTSGPSSGSVEQTTNKNMVSSLDFDTTTQQFAQFSVWFPKSWNLGTVTFQPCFSQLTTAAGGVVFGLQGVAVSDGDALDVAFGTAQTSTKTAGTANLEYQGPESAAITIAGTPAAGDRVMFQVNRTVADGSDTLAQNARLHGIRIFFTTNAATDA